MGSQGARPEERRPSRHGMRRKHHRKQGDWHKEKWLPQTRRPETPKEGWKQRELVLKPTESS